MTFDESNYYKGLEAKYWDALKDYEELRINGNDFVKIQNAIWTSFGIITNTDLCCRCVRRGNCPVSDMHNDESESIVGCRFFTAEAESR